MRALLAKATTIAEIVSVECELTRREADLEALLAKQKSSPCRPNWRRSP